ncbi:MAG: molybdopterin-dependent oxidoreductase [Acidobacteria bacterium]|nr:molybdopterin-dependent oxidoreductase [Acidobacteriota bacterium]
MRLDRRGFLFLAGGAAGGAAVGGLTLKGISRLNEALAPEMGSYPGEEKFALSLCRSCSGGCGLRVRTVAGRVVKIDGNPLYPVNRGGVCPKAQALLQGLYHPDRILTPRRRNSAEQPWETASWPEALETLAGTLRKLRAEKRQNKVVVVSGRGAGLPHSLLARFLAAYGNAQLFQLPSGLEVSEQALELMGGSPSNGGSRRLAYDLENSRCVLSFGCDLLQGWGTPAYTLKVFGKWHDSTRGQRTTLIHFGPRLSVSAARADEWVSAQVGTWAAIALGIAFVLISEDLYNRDFVENCTFGFEDWTDREGRSHMGFRRLVREEYRLSRVSELTGIPPETFVRVAREFAAGTGAVAIGPQQSPGQPGRLTDALAVHALNALVGSIGARGGVALLPDPGWPLPGAPQKNGQGSHSLEDLSQALEDSPQVLVLDDAALLFDLLSTAEQEKLRRIPLVVTTASLEDVTTGGATLHLPDCTSLESWADGQAPACFPYELLSVAAPVLSPLGESRPWGETLLALAQATDPATASAVPWKDLPELLRASAELLAGEQRGYLFGPEVDEQWQRLLERSGWWAPDWSSPQQFWEAITTQGGWWNPISWPMAPQRSFPTPSGLFELYPQKLEQWLRQQPNLRVSVSSPEWNRMVLPHHSELLPPTDPNQFTLLLDPYDPLPFFGGGGREIPFLQQLSSSLGDNQWRSWVELSEEDAEHLGIHNGDLVWVESAAGRIRRRALVMEGAMPGIVGAPSGGAPSSGRWASHEDSLADILVPVQDPILGTRCATVTRVNVYKA